MTIKKFGEHSQMQARYAVQNEKGERVDLEKEAIAALKGANLGAVREAVLGVSGDPSGIAKQLAVANSEGALRDHLLSAKPADTEQALRALKSRNVKLLIQTADGSSATIKSASLLSPLRDAVREEDPAAIAKALVDAVRVRGISYEQWRGMLEKLKLVKDIAGPDLTHLVDRSAKQALQQDLIKLFYEPLLAEIDGAQLRQQALVRAFPGVTKPDVLEALAFATKTTSFSQGRAVFQEGHSPVSSIFVIVSGKAHVEKGGKPLEGVSLRAGDPLGLHALAGGAAGRSRQASIIADEKLEVVEIPINVVKQLREANPELDAHLTRTLARRAVQLAPK